MSVKNVDVASESYTVNEIRLNNSVLIMLIMSMTVTGDVSVTVTTY